MPVVRTVEMNGLTMEFYRQATPRDYLALYATFETQAKTGVPLVDAHQKEIYKEYKDNWISWGTLPKDAVRKDPPKSPITPVSGSDPITSERDREMQRDRNEKGGGEPLAFRAAGG